jgi:hypothetical protein
MVVIASLVGTVLEGIAFREREVSIMILLAEQWGGAIREENKNSRSPVGSLRVGGREIWSRSPVQRSSIKVLSHQIRLA